MDKISVITVCYNSEETIEDTLKSVANQNYPSVEHLVVDGLSSDNTCTIIRENMQGIGQFVSEKDKGLYDAMNKGVKLATGSVVGILNSDDLYQDDTVLSDVMSLFDSSKADAVYGDLVYVDKYDTSKVVRYWKAGSYHHGKFKNGWMPPHPTFFVRREIYDRLGLFNTNLRSAADYEIMLRFLHKHRIKVAYLPRIITRMRTGGMSNQTLSHRIKANREDRKAWEINDLKPYPWTLLLKPLSKLSQFFSKP